MWAHFEVISGHSIPFWSALTWEGQIGCLGFLIEQSVRFRLADLLIEELINDSLCQFLFIPHLWWTSSPTEVDGVLFHKRMWADTKWHGKLPIHRTDGHYRLLSWFRCPGDPMMVCHSGTSDPIHLHVREQTWNKVTFMGSAAFWMSPRSLADAAAAVGYRGGHSMMMALYSPNGCEIQLKVWRFEFQHISANHQ